MASRALNGLPAVNCARPSRWGNPFKIQQPTGDPQLVMLDAANGVCFSAEAVVERFRASIDADRKKEIVSKLRGKNLACWCDLYVCDKCGAKYASNLSGRCVNNLSEPGHGAWRCTGRIIRPFCHVDVLMELANK